ncbi:MAG: EAL domain-containing protein [Leptolyngbyaceae cyanobacterium]
MFPQGWPQNLHQLPLRIKTRLGASFVLMACVLGGVGMHTIHSMNRLSALTTKLYDHPFTVNTAVLRVEVGIVSMHRSMKDVVLAENSAEVDAAVGTVIRLEQEVLHDFDIIYDYFLGNLGEIEVARQQFTNWREIRDRVIQLRRDGNIDAAAAITKGEGAQYIQDLLEEIDQVEAFAANKANEFLADAQSTRRHTLQITTLLILLAAGLTILWVIWMIRILSVREQTRTQLTQQHRRAEALLALPRMAEDREEATFMQYGQELAENLTNSQISFVHLIHDDENTIELVNWSRRTLKHYCHAVHDSHYPVSKAGIWADALRQRRPVVFNDYETYADKNGLPQGHAPLNRLISIPVIEHGKVVMLTGVGNKSTHYTDWDVETVQLISNDIWRIVKGNRALARLTKSEGQLRKAQHVASIGSWELKLKTQVFTCSDEVFRIFEVEPDQMQDTLNYAFVLKAIHPDDRDRVNRTYQQSVEQHTPCEIDYRLSMADGRIKYVQAQYETYYETDGTPDYSIGTIQDVTKQFLSAEKLREAAAVFKSTAEGVVITDLDGVIMDVNQAFSTITGYDREEAIGQNPRLLKSDRHPPNFYSEMWHSLVSNGHWQGEIWNRSKSGTIYPELLTINSIEDETGKATGYVGVFSDITLVKQSEQQLYILAHHNPLTQLPNRRLFNLRLQQSIHQATGQEQGLALLFIDMDRFKQINDSMGHATGDALLEQVGQRLRDGVRSSDMVAHLNGDEFVILLEHIAVPETVTTILRKVMQYLADPFQIEHPIHSETQEIYLTCSIGISLFPQDGVEAPILLRNADTAMHHAKSQGRNTYCFYSEKMTTDAFAHVQMENALRGALPRQELYLVYQPQLNFATQEWSGMEALLRWQHPQFGQVSPGQFIPLAEQSGLIREIGCWVLQQACIQGQAWLGQGIKCGRIAVNIAGPQFQSGDLIPSVAQALSISGFPANQLELEVTEGFMMQQPQERIRELEQLRQLGVKIAIDDFGTGYSSLSYLKQLPIDKLKIDQSFVRDIPQDGDDMAIAQAIIALGKALDLRIIAEGVETEEQASLLTTWGCHEAQGYLYSRPIVATEIPALFQQGCVQR